MLGLMLEEDTYISSVCEFRDKRDLVLSVVLAFSNSVSIAPFFLDLKVVC